MKVLGLGHYSRTGKNTLANMIGLELAEHAPEMRVEITAFAAKLKDICHQLYAWDGMREESFYETPEGTALRDVKLPTVGKTPVEIWIDMGTPAVRERVYKNTWVDYVLKADRTCDVLIVTDVRFHNEVELIRQMGGDLIKLVRTGQGPRNSVADLPLVGWDGWDYVAGPTLEELAKHASTLAEYLRYDEPIDQFISDRDKILAHEVLPEDNILEAFRETFTEKLMESME